MKPGQNHGHPAAADRLDRLDRFSQPDADRWNEVHATSIRLGHDRNHRVAKIRVEADCDGCGEHIITSASFVLALLELHEQIVAAATVEPAAFDRDAYDALWTRWHALAAQETTP